MIINGEALSSLRVFHPVVAAKRPGEVASYGMTESGYDLRIRQTVEFKFFLGLIRYTVVDGDGPRRWHLGHNVLASTVERITMPRTATGVVGNKSTWARLWLDASHSTDIEPGWEGWLTLELRYRGRKPLRVPAGDGICNVKLHTTSNQRSYVGKYQQQGKRPTEAIRDR